MRSSAMAHPRDESALPSAQGGRPFGWLPFSNACVFRPTRGVKGGVVPAQVLDSASSGAEPTLNPLIVGEPRFTDKQRDYLLRLAAVSERVEVVAFDEKQRPVVKIWDAGGLRVSALLKRGGEGLHGRKLKPWPPSASGSIGRRRVRRRR
jgi:hypothetical protein